MKVLITSNSFGKFDNGPKQKMLDLGWEVVGNRYHHIMNEEEMIGEVPGVDAIILGSDCLNKNVLDHADKLKIISRYGVGLDNVDLEEAKQRGIEVTITRNCNTEAVADYTIALMLDTLRHVSQVDRDLRAGNWKKETGLDLCHKTVGVIGLGAIGRQVVKRLHGFDCKILGFDLYPNEAFCKENNVELLPVEEILKQADVITLHIPANEDGSPVISKEELDLMKSTAVLINSARAALVDQDAVIEALKTGKIYGYGTDVFKEEPHMDPEFAELNNAVLSPHNAAVSVEAVNKMTALSVQHILDYFKVSE